MELNGALLVNKHPGITSFGVVDAIKRQLCRRYQLRPKQLPKVGHGGTLDPFATGLLVVLIGSSVKLARYFLGATKTYEGVIHFGETTIPGDPTAPVSEKTDQIPDSLEALQEKARRLAEQPYQQTPPMFSAKKHQGRPLYELARAGIEVEREPKTCHLYQFEILSYEAPRAKFRLRCSSGTYVRTLAQDFGRMMGSLAYLESLERTASGSFSLAHAQTVAEIESQLETPAGDGQTKSTVGFQELKAWVPFDRLLEGYQSAEATLEEARALYQGKQTALFQILRRNRDRLSPTGDLRLPDLHCLAIFHHTQLVAVARQESTGWRVERVFGSLQ